MLGAMQPWQNFYVIMGSGAAALIGIQFLVTTLLSSRPAPAVEEGIAAFGTPTVVHLSVIVLVSGIMTAPWPSTFGMWCSLCATSVAGLAYSCLVYFRARRQRVYEPLMEDWVWYVILPLLAYAALALTTVALRRSGNALFYVAASVLAILFIAIHNSWDTVTHIVVTMPVADASSQAASSTGQKPQS